MTNSSFARAVMDEFKALNGYLDAVSDALTAGHMPDIRGFEQRVKQLCETIAAESDHEHKQAYSDVLRHVLARLDQCEQQMRAFHQAQAKAAN